MPTSRALHEGTVRVAEHLCSAGPPDSAAHECFGSWTIAYVRRGSFGCRCGTRQHELVPGSLLLGRPGDEFVCTHDHHAGGDECLSFHYAPALLDELCGAGRPWQSGVAAPAAELAGVGAAAQAVVQCNGDASLDELGLLLAHRVLQRADAAARRRAPRRSAAADRRRAVESALWIDAHSAGPIGLADMARQAGLSAFHYLRLFGTVLQVTPHQYLLRCRVRKAAALLVEQPRRSVTEVALDVGFADLSNFERTFRRAAGLAPHAWRKTAARERKIFQAGPAGAA